MGKCYCDVILKAEAKQMKRVNVVEILKNLYKRTVLIMLIMKIMKICCIGVLTQILMIKYEKKIVNYRCFKTFEFQSGR